MADQLCCRCRNYQTPDKKLFTNTWIGQRHVVSQTYLTYRWVVAILTLIFLAESTYRRVVQDGEWRYWLYLTTWVQVAAFLTYWLEVGLVTIRRRREQHGEVGSGELTSYAESSSSGLPASHRLLWVTANINSTLSVLTSIIYWSFVYSPGLHPLDMQNLSGHALITAINILDVFISARPWRCLHAYHSQLFCLVYALSNFAYIEEEGTSIYETHYLYSVLDWSKPTHCLLTIFAVALLLPFIHIIFIILYKLRSSIETVGQRKQKKDPSKPEIEMGRISLLSNKM